MVAGAEARGARRRAAPLQVEAGLRPEVEVGVEVRGLALRGRERGGEVAGGEKVGGGVEAQGVSLGVGEEGFEPFGGGVGGVEDGGVGEYVGARGVA